MCADNYAGPGGTDIDPTIEICWAAKFEPGTFDCTLFEFSYYGKMTPKAKNGGNMYVRKCEPFTDTFGTVHSNVELRLKNSAVYTINGAGTAAPGGGGFTGPGDNHVNFPASPTATPPPSFQFDLFSTTLCPACTNPS